MLLNRSVRWQGVDPKTIEHCHVVANGRDTRIRSAMIGPDFGLFYRLKLDEAGHTRTVRIERADGKLLELFSDGMGSWSDDRAEPIPALKGAIHVDIWPTPLTNSLPIWSQDWETGISQTFAMVYIDATTMSVERTEQTYTRLDRTHYRFTSGDFDAVIEVDGDGAVVNYPGLFVAE
jgi:hypothetical protein